MIDTLRKRESALIDPWAILTPDALIDREDREALIGQYAGIPAEAVSPIPPTGGGGSETRLYDSAGLRKYLPSHWITGRRWELHERGGFMTGSLSFLATWEQMRALGLTGTEYVDFYVFGELVYRGRITQPDWSIDNPESGTLNLCGLVERLDHYLCDAHYAYGVPVDISILFERILRDWAVKAGRLPNLVIETHTIGVTVQTFDGTGKTVAQSLNALLDMAPDLAIWGTDVDGSGLDRAYIRTRSQTTAYRYRIGGNVQAFTYPPDYGSVVNIMRLKGGKVSQPNLLSNGSFEQAVPNSETAGNLLQDYSFETGSPWTLSGGASRFMSGDVGNLQGATSRTGDWLVELDNPGEEVSQIVDNISAAQVYVASCYARRETANIAADVNIIVEGLDSGGSPVLGASSQSGYQDPGGSQWKQFTITVNFASYPSVEKLKVRYVTSLGSSGATGTLLDDCGLWERDGVANSGWAWAVTGAAKRVSLDWVNRDVTPKHGAYCVKMQASGIAIGADCLEIYTNLSARVRVSPAQLYTFAAFVRGDGSNPISYSIGVAEYDSTGTLTANTESATTNAGGAAWTLIALQVTMNAATATAQVYVRTRNNNILYVDATALIEGNLPTDWYNGGYWAGEEYEQVWSVLDVPPSVPGRAPAGLSAAAAASIADFGEREAEESNENVIDRETSAAFAIGYLNAHAVPSVQARLKCPIGDAMELLAQEGAVKLLNLPSAPDPLFPSRIVYEETEAGLTMDADLGSERPTMAEFLRLTETHRLSP